MLHNRSDSGSIAAAHSCSNYPGPYCSAQSCTYYTSSHTAAHGRSNYPGPYRSTQSCTFHTSSYPAAYRCSHYPGSNNARPHT